MKRIFLILLFSVPFLGWSQQNWTQSNDTNRGTQIYNSAGALGYSIRTNAGGGWAWQLVDGNSASYFNVDYPSGNVQVNGSLSVNDKSFIDRLIFQQITEPNGEALVSAVTGQQRGLFVKDRTNMSGGLWLFGGGSVTNQINSGGVGAGFTSDLATYIPFTTAASAVTFGDGNINFFANNGLTAGQVYYPSPKMILSNSGYLGIGTPSPSQKLEVNGSVFQNSENAAMGIDAQTNARLGFIKKYGYAPMIASDITSPIIFAQSNQNGVHTNISGATLTERMRIDVNGNVGIGNVSPDAKLAVSGQVHAQEVKVSVAVPGPDYVFEKDYKLTSLEEIKNYIDQNKHLPEVPSAKEMEKNGVQLGEMNMLLLKKIEELTLYVIEQNKRIADQQREISELKTLLGR